MFERFTDRARRVLVLAQEEARLLDHSFIGTEHVLLGLIAEGDGVGAQALSALGISLEAVRARIEETIGLGQTSVAGSPPFTPRTKKVLELSLREALELGHSYIDTEHLLLGLVREGDGVAAHILVTLGADLPSVRQATLNLMDPSKWVPPVGRRVDLSPRSMAGDPGWAPPVWDRPSEGTMPAVLPVEAMVFQNDLVAVGIEHLEVYSNGFAVNVVTLVNPHKVREMMEARRPRSPSWWPDVTVRFADGSTTRRGGGVGSRFEPPKDTRGVPTEPIVMMTDGRGERFGWRTRAWVFPLPPDGPLEILVAFEAVGLSEVSVTVDGTAVRAAADRAHNVWT